MEAPEGVEVQLHSILTLVLDESMASFTPQPICLPSSRYHVNSMLGVGKGRIAPWKRIDISCPFREMNNDPLVA
jgi:hypothetical protein